MNRIRIWLGAALIVGLVAALAFSSFGAAAVRHVSALIAPTSKSAVADVNAFANWTPSTFSRDGFSKVTHIPTGVYCLSGRANPDKSMLIVTIDNQHSNVRGGAVVWNRSSAFCGPGLYEVWTFCRFFDQFDAPGPRQGIDAAPCDEVAFFAEAFVRA